MINIIMPRDKWTQYEGELISNSSLVIMFNDKYAPKLGSENPLLIHNMPNMPHMPNMHNMHSMPNMPNMPNMLNMPNMFNLPKAYFAYYFAAEIAAGR